MAHKKSAKGATGFDEMMDALLRLDQHLADAAVSNLWLPGLDVDYVFAELGFEPPPEVRAWFAWHGGIDPERVAQAKEHGRSVSTAISPDGFVPDGPPKFWEYDSRRESFVRPYWFDSRLRLIPMGTLMQGNALLRPSSDPDVWRLCWAHPEALDSPAWFPKWDRAAEDKQSNEPVRDRSEPTAADRLQEVESNPTLLEYVAALNRGFESGTVKVLDHRIHCRIYGDGDYSPDAYPWTWR